MLLAVLVPFCVIGGTSAVDLNYVLSSSQQFAHAFQSIISNKYDETCIEVANRALKSDFGAKTEDIHLNVSQLIHKYNHPVEEHQVETQDGYLLTLVRIPCRHGDNCPVVFLMHGLASSCDCYVTAGCESGLAYVLAAEGYDVWMGNARGNKYSRKHARLSPDKDKKFWDFSWHEIGIYDIPAMMDYILKVTDQTQLVYIGHSQGTTAFFVMCSESPEYNSKVSLMISLSTMAWVSHLKSPIIRTLALLPEDALEALFGVELLPSNVYSKLLTSLMCGTPSRAFRFCSTVVFSLFGFNCGQVNEANLPVIFNHVPGGAATKQIKHYAQEIKSGHFRQYDYGKQKNIIRYGTKTPPDYGVDKVTAPVVLFYGDNDWLSDIADLDILKAKLPNVIDTHRVPCSEFSHGDYLWARDVRKLVYEKILHYINNAIAGN